MDYVEVEREEFFTVAASMEYRDDDVKEALEFGCPSVLSCYKKAQYRFARYFFVRDSAGTPVVTVMLQRDGHIIFFIDKNVNEHIALIRVLKRMARNVVDRVGPIVTKTAYWYEEARRVNRLIGFKDLVLMNYFGYYYFD